MAVETLPPPQEKTQSDRKSKILPPYHVILLNDDDHTFEYVVKMLKELFGHPEETGSRMAEEVHKSGRVIVDTTSKERAEFKQEQIHAYGPDESLARCKGSMTCVIEPSA